MRLYAKNEMTALLEKNGFFFKKNLGQNFLLNESIAGRIADAARESLSGDKPTLALEIGPGAGALTLQLSRRFDQVLALEIDPHLIPVLEESLEETENVTVLNCDALKFDLAEIRKRYPGYDVAVCSNLPYYITSDVIMRLLTGPVPIKSVTVLIQREAADRLCAPPASPSYGAITAAVQYYAESKKLFTVGPGNFLPRPQVDSAVLRLIPRSEPTVKPLSEEVFFSVIRAAFAARRKTLVNALSVAFGSELTKDEVSLVLERAGIRPDRRGETLSLPEFCSIADELVRLEESK